MSTSTALVLRDGETFVRFSDSDAGTLVECALSFLVEHEYRSALRDVVRALPVGGNGSPPASLLHPWPLYASVVIVVEGTRVSVRFKNRHDGPEATIALNFLSVRERQILLKWYPLERLGNKKKEEIFV